MLTDVGRDGQVAQQPEVDAAGQPHGGEPEHGPDGLLHPLRPRVVARQVLADAGCGVDHHHADGDQRQDRGQQREAELVPLAADAAASGARPSDRRAR